MQPRYPATHLHQFLANPLRIIGLAVALQVQRQVLARAADLSMA